MLEVDRGDFDPELVLERLIREVGDAEGVTAVRLLDRDARIVASLDAGERGRDGESLAGHPDAADDAAWIGRDGDRLRVASPVSYSDVLVGEAQVEFDLRILVDPVVRSSTEQLAAVAVVVVVVRSVRAPRSPPLIFCCRALSALPSSCPRAPPRCAAYA